MKSTASEITITLPASYARRWLQDTRSSAVAAADHSTLQQRIEEALEMHEAAAALQTNIAQPGVLGDAVKVHPDGISIIKLDEPGYHEQVMMARYNVYTQQVEVHCQCGEEWALPPDLAGEEVVHMCPTKCGRGVVVKR